MQGAPGHARVDERTAGFLALGLGKRTRRPAVLVTTSGTAVAMHLRRCSRHTTRRCRCWC